VGRDVQHRTCRRTGVVDLMSLDPLICRARSTS
jgi:hypothetical protein